VRRMAAEHGIDLTTIPGTGATGASASRTSRRSSRQAELLLRRRQPFRRQPLRVPRYRPLRPRHHRLRVFPADKSTRRSNRPSRARRFISATTPSSP
jgi:hypothetical protein